MDPISHTQAYRPADKIRGVMAGAVRDDEHRGGEREQFTGNHTLPRECWSGGWACIFASSPARILFQGVFLRGIRSIHSAEFNQECLKC